MQDSTISDRLTNPPPCYCPGPLVISRGEHLASCDRRRRGRVTREDAAVRDAQIVEAAEDEARFAALRRRHAL